MVTDDADYEAVGTMAISEALVAILEPTFDQCLLTVRGVRRSLVSLLVRATSSVVEPSLLCHCWCSVMPDACQSILQVVGG